MYLHMQFMELSLWGPHCLSQVYLQDNGVRVLYSFSIKKQLCVIYAHEVIIMLLFD